jgi:histidine triad (HIT) family protein
MDCIFCRIAAGEIPAQIVYQNEDVVAFRDVNPQSPVHVLVIPREHVQGPLALGDGYAALAGKLIAAAAEVARQEGIAESGYRLVMNEGRQAQQSVFHVHLHVLGGRPMHWPPG